MKRTRRIDDVSALEPLPLLKNFTSVLSIRLDSRLEIWEQELEEVAREATTHLTISDTSWSCLVD